MSKTAEKDATLGAELTKFLNRKAGRELMAAALAETAVTPEAIREAAADQIGLLVNEKVDEATGPALKSVQDAAEAIKDADVAGQIDTRITDALAELKSETGTGEIRVGSRVEFRQRNEWLLMLVTHVHDAETVSGVAFSGIPARLGWHRGAMEFANVKRGEDNRNWRPRQ